MRDQNSKKDKPVLVIVEGPLRGQQWVLHKDRLVIGRGAECDIVIPERRISREHVEVCADQDGNYFVRDLNSRNGTHVNGTLLEEARQLSEGDEIQIAFTVKVKFVGSEATVPLTAEDIIDTADRLVLDRHSRQVIVSGKNIQPQLSLYQYRLLELLFDNAGGVCSRDEVIRAVWPDAAEEGISEQAIDALVRRLRDRLAEVDAEHQYIVTVRGHGFRLEQPKDEA